MAQQLDTEALSTVTIRRDVMIDAPIEISFEAVLEELGVGSELPDGTPFPMKVEPWPGGRWYRDLGEMGGHKAGHLWGHVQVIKAPTLLEIVGPMAMSFAATNHLQYRLKTEGDGTRVTLVHCSMGTIPPGARESMPQGWQHGLNRVKQVAEQKAGAATR